MEAGRRFHDLAAAAETSGRRELITVWAKRSATGCRLNAGDDGLRQRLFAAAFRRGEVCRSCAMQATKCQYTESELYSLADLQPMQVVEKWSD